MSRLHVLSRRPAWFPLVFAALVGCAPGQFTTLVIYDKPEAFVRLEADRTVGSGRGHSHPASMSLQHMRAVLSGITIEEPLAKLPIYDDLRQARHHPAFTEKEIMLFAPLLAAALSKATPEEVVTFYESRDLSGTSREVTSGGLFVEGEELHVLLGNYRSQTHYNADIGVADTQDDRMTPLQALAPQRGILGFEPAHLRRSVTPKGLSRIFYWDKRELVILYHGLPTHSSADRPIEAPPELTRP